MVAGAATAMEPSIGSISGSPWLLRSSGLLALPRCASFRPRATATSPPQQDEQGGNAEPSEAFVSTGQEQRRSKGQGFRGYGSAPVELTISPSWGGKNSIDPLAGTGGYIWKKNWQPYVEAPPSKVVAPYPKTVKEPDSGFLSITRSLTLDNMDVDLSQELMKPSKATLQRHIEAAQELATPTLEGEETKGPQWRLAPTRREEERWARSRKAMTGGSEVMAIEVERAQIDPVAAAEKQRLWYLELKRNLQILTLGIGGLGTTCAYMVYSPEIAGSYGAGLIGAFAYIRMLGQSVDGLGAGSLEGAARGAMGSPRLLVPVVLVMVYNRWNSLLVPEYGLMHLDLIPMLLGFFTYKAATLVETFKELLPSNGEQDT